MTEITLRCPACGAGGNREATCRRCKADLSLLEDLERSRAGYLARAAFHARRGEARACREDARQAHGLRAGADSARWLAVGSLLARDFDAAWCWWQTAAG